MGQLWVDEADPTKLVVNSNSWTNISSMLCVCPSRCANFCARVVSHPAIPHLSRFMEAPACVGYSYADTIDGCTHDDHSQAVDNYQALLSFFSGFPEYKNNSFFITGESYAGI